MANSPDNNAITLWHTREVDDVWRALHTDIARGLDDAEATRRHERDGANALPAPRRPSIAALAVHQFKSVIVALLVVATVVAFVFGEYLDGSAILVVIVLNALLGFVVEYKAERTLAALREQDVRTAVVLRGGVERAIDANDLVVGDVVILEAGARVPADARVLAANGLQVEEAALTGEAIAVDKDAAVVVDAAAAIADRTDMVHASTTVTAGRGRVLVTAIGTQTELGKIGALIDEVASRQTPLEQQLARLGRLLIVVVLALTAVIVLVGWWRGHPLLAMVKLGISLAIAAVPEGLTAVTTMTLAIGMQRMAQLGALIRRLPAVETLGATTVICTDKTGTLTKNEMTVRALVLADGRHVDVTGSGYDLDGTLSVDQNDPALQRALHIGALCNDARLQRGDTTVVLGDPTEGALIVVAEKAGVDVAALVKGAPRLAEQPFSSTTQRMVTVHRDGEQQVLLYVKGSPGVIIASSALSDDDRRRHLEENTALAGQAMRVLALAYCSLPAGAAIDDAAIDAAVAHDLVYIGLVAMQDPLREAAQAAIATCKTAGIRTIMITGDQPATASEIARQLGIDVDDAGRPRKTVRGRDLVALDEAGWLDAVTTTAVFARVSPEQKLQIVQALQKSGEVVAMTGDGVNDAPALKTADIGVAMGKKGTAVAKDTADMIITDDNFATMVVAVEQGRVIYANIQKFILYLFSCNIAEITTVFVAMIVGWPVPLLALQILWLNLLTDVFPAFALALEPSAPKIMLQPPRSPQTSIVDRAMVGRILWQGALLSTATLTSFVVGLRWHGQQGPGLQIAMTMAFMTLGFLQIIQAFTARSRSQSLCVGLFVNRWLWAAVVGCVVLQLATVTLSPLRAVLHTRMPGALDWLVIAGCALAPAFVSEIVKGVQRRRHSL